MLYHYCFVLQSQAASGKLQGLSIVSSPFMGIVFFMRIVFFEARLSAVVDNRIVNFLIDSFCLFFIIH